MTYAICIYEEGMWWTVAVHQTWIAAVLEQQNHERMGFPTRLEVVGINQPLP